MKKILIADDEPDIVKVIKFRLIKMGYEIHVAANGRDAVDMIKGIKPDLVLLDFSMPFLTGDEVCIQAKNDPDTKHIPVILMTASSHKVTDEHIAQIGANGHILKPFETQELIDKVQAFLK